MIIVNLDLRSSGISAANACNSFPTNNLSVMNCRKALRNATGECISLLRGASLKSRIIK